MSLRVSLLGSNADYAAFLKLIRVDRFLESFVTDALQFQNGQRLIDLGCGNGALAPHTVGTDYTGIDHNPAYLEGARRDHHGPGRRFVCAELTDLAYTESGILDAVCAVASCIISMIDSQ